MEATRSNAKMTAKNNLIPCGEYRKTEESYFRKGLNLGESYDFPRTTPDARRMSYEPRRLNPLKDHTVKR